MDKGNYLNDILSPLKPKNNRFLFIIVAIVFTILVDSQIGTVSDFIPMYLSSTLGVSLFVGLTVFSIFFFLLYYKLCQEYQ